MSMSHKAPRTILPSQYHFPEDGGEQLLLTRAGRLVLQRAFASNPATNFGSQANCSNAYACWLSMECIDRLGVSHH